MRIIIWFFIVVVVLYTIGFGHSLWKKKNKIGASAVFILACLALLLPYFTYFRS